ncbi:hypothetical protein KRP22_012605 [Phytophthora ramorum]|nr:hypothetical protein KRP22_12997 [Phytophthora ramorum]
MRLLSSALTVTVLTLALLTPAVQPHYLAGSAPGGWNHGGDNAAGGIQHGGTMPTAPHPHDRRGEPGPVGWKPKKHFATNAALLMPSGLDDAVMSSPHSPDVSDRQLRLRGRGD